MTIVTCTDAGQWDAYVSTVREASNYHRWGWKAVLENAFGWPTFYFLAQDEGVITGALPLVWQKSLVFGSFLTSLPFFSYGGVLANDPATGRELVNRAITLTRELRANRLELRHRCSHLSDLPTHFDKVSVFMEVIQDDDTAMNALRHKVRTLIRKAIKSNLTAEICGGDALDEFYEVFATNMRDLGTPVYSKAFFREMVQIFPMDIFFCLVKLQGKTIAASLLIGFRDTLEIVWAASLRSYRHLAPNMLMYWKMTRFAAQRGFRILDLGRSTVNSGPHQFKLQWSSQQVALAWQYWAPRESSAGRVGPDNPKYRLAIRAWQRLPVALTKVVGPPIVRCLP